VAAKALLGESERTEPVSLAGRLMVKRLQGGVVVRRPAGRPRAHSSSWRTAISGEEEFNRFADLDPGDLIGVKDDLQDPARGDHPEVQSFQLLTKSLRPLPEKWHGLKDVEIRYRQRYVDLIANRRCAMCSERAPGSSPRCAAYSTNAISRCRHTGLQEVPGGGHARPFVTHHNSLDRDLFLRIALELHLSGFAGWGVRAGLRGRAGVSHEGLSPRHNPEFTLLECYQAYADYDDVMRLVEDLFVVAAMAAGRPLETATRERPLTSRRRFGASGWPTGARAHGKHAVGEELNELFEEHR